MRDGARSWKGPDFEGLTRCLLCRYAWYLSCKGEQNAFSRAALRAPVACESTTHLVPEEAARNVDVLASDNRHRLTRQNLLGQDGSETAKEMSLSVDDVWLVLLERHLRREKPGISF